MIRINKEFEVIHRFRNGESIRKISRDMDIDRKTIRRIRDRYQAGIDALDDAQNEKEIEAATEQLVLERKYDTSNRKKRTFTPEVEARMSELLEKEREKDRRLGPHKQALTAKAVYEILAEEGYAIKYRTVAHYWSKMKAKAKEAFIKQNYALGARVEFDFGEVKLEIEGVVKTYYLAVWASPASDYYWAYLYTNQKKAVFQDAHVRFFEDLGGVYAEVVYDNMRNVVTRFIGRNEKELNPQLIQLATYYGFNINVTNCFSGNEKGTVESRVKHVRQNCFTKKYQFQSLDEARQHLEESLRTLNQDSRLEEEKGHLLKYRPPFELAELCQLSVTKYATIHYQKNQYSVPDYLVGQRVQIKAYADYLVVYANEQEVARHNKIEGSHGFQLDISHYIKTLKKKPGALEHSLVLQQTPGLETLYHKYYSGHPKEFIEQLEKYQSLSGEALCQQLAYDQLVQRVTTENEGVPKNQEAILHQTEATLHQLNALYGLEESLC